MGRRQRNRVNGDRYEGEWRNGRMHGKGVKVMANGDVYNGTWENDKAEGNGVKVRHRGVSVGSGGGDVVFWLRWCCAGVDAVV